MAGGLDFQAEGGSLPSLRDAGARKQRFPPLHPPRLGCHMTWGASLQHTRPEHQPCARPVPGEGEHSAEQGEQSPRLQQTDGQEVGK